VNARRGYARGSFGQVHFREHGEGEPLILLHKTPSSSIMFSRTLPLFGRNYRAIAIDTPGFGMSDPPPAAATIAFFADVVREVMDDLSLPSAHVLGYSTGAAIALELAAADPDRVRKLVLAHYTPRTKDADRSAAIASAGDFATPTPLDPQGNFLERYPLNQLRRWLRGDDAEQFYLELIAYLQALPEYLVAYHALMEYEAFSRLAAVKSPTLFLRPSAPRSIGSAPAMSQAQGRELDDAVRAALPSVTCVEIQATNEVVMEDPSLFARAVTDFLAV
jgi:pimeloyl-ACP methyl ester carboxylesterase